jgi:hypothetical protein
MKQLKENHSKFNVNVRNMKHVVIIFTHIYVWKVAKKENEKTAQEWNVRLKQKSGAAREWEEAKSCVICGGGSDAHKSTFAVW